MPADKIQRYHKELVQAIKQNAQELQKGNRYIGTPKPWYAMKSAVAVKIGRDWINCHPDLTAAEYFQLLDSLSTGETSNEIGYIGYFLAALPRYRKQLSPRRLERWLAHAQGWAEVDSICQGKFTAEEVVSKWEAWRPMIIALRSSRNINKRRASLVLLTRAVRDTADPRLSALAFENIQLLKGENDILITKAVSWLLREMIKNYRRELEAFLDANADTLPKVALRETRNKLRSGRKSGH